MAILVDTNILLDVVNPNSDWWDWSVREMDAASAEGTLIINDVVYAEFAGRFDRLSDLDDVIAAMGLSVEHVPRPALFLSSKAFLKYKSLGGTRVGILPDFFIGAHAAVAKIPLLTRDAARFRTYFPTIELIAPNQLN